MGTLLKTPNKLEFVSPLCGFDHKVSALSSLGHLISQLFRKFGYKKSCFNGGSGRTCRIKRLVEDIKLII